MKTGQTDGLQPCLPSAEPSHQRQHQQHRQQHQQPVMLVTEKYHWRRSVVKCRRGQGQSGQATKLFQITPYVNDFQTLNNPRS